MRIKKSTSQKQLEANRKNALRSTGPKTWLGKKRASKNAVRHGLLSSEIIVDGITSEETRVEFDSLLRRLWEQFSPEGSIEEMPVDQVAVYYWRLRLVVRCETGERTKLMTSVVHDEVQRRVRSFQADLDLVAEDKLMEARAKQGGYQPRKYQAEQDYTVRETTGLVLQTSSRGINTLISLLNYTRKQFQSTGYIPDKLQMVLEKSFGIEYGSAAVWTGATREAIDRLRAKEQALQAELDRKAADREDDIDREETDDIREKTHAVQNEHRSIGTELEDRAAEVSDEASEHIACTPNDKQRINAELQDLKQRLLDYLKTETDRLSALLVDVLQGERLYFDGQLRSMSLPPSPALERILRYETAIQRQLSRALDQLERLQRQRKGDKVRPAPCLSIEK